MALAFRRDFSGRWLTGIAVAAVAAVVGALVSQHWFEMRPCAWCVLQRVIFMLIALAAGAGAALGSAIGRLWSAALVLALAVCGIAAGLWQHFVAAKSASCDMTLADRLVAATGLNQALPEVFAPYASCADAAVNLFGLPYVAWSLALFVLFVLAALAVLRRVR